MSGRDANGWRGNGKCLSNDGCRYDIRVLMESAFGSMDFENS